MMPMVLATLAMWRDRHRRRWEKGSGKGWGRYGAVMTTMTMM